MYCSAPGDEAEDEHLAPLALAQESWHKDEPAESSTDVHWLVTSSGAEGRELILARRTASIRMAMTALLAARIVSDLCRLLCPPDERYNSPLPVRSLKLSKCRPSSVIGLPATGATSREALFLSLFPCGSFPRLRTLLAANPSLSVGRRRDMRWPITTTIYCAKTSLSLSGLLVMPRLAAVLAWHKHFRMRSDQLEATRHDVDARLNLLLCPILPRSWVGINTNALQNQKRLTRHEIDKPLIVGPYLWT